MIVTHVVCVVAGLLVVAAVLLSAVRTVVLPGGDMPRITRFVFAVTHRGLVHNRTGSVWQRSSDLYGPVGLVSLPFVWAFLVTIGFALLYYGLHVDGPSKSFVLSGSSLLTLGFASPENDQVAWLTFLEATIGLGLVTLLISYLPTIYTAYSGRERGMSLLRPLAGTPPEGAEMLCRLQSTGTMGQPGIWEGLTSWFADLDQSHSSFPTLCWFRPHRRGDSWVAAAGAALDAAALVLSTVDVEGDPVALQSVLVVAQGAPALVSIGQAAGLPLADPPTIADVRRQWHGPAPEISLSRDEYDTAVARIVARGVRTNADADESWTRFAWIRSCYDDALRGLAGAVGAAPAPWTTDRPAAVGRPRLVRNRPVRVDFPRRRAAPEAT